MKKQKSHAFGKDVYLLGINEDGEYVWLESPSWDCGWYWGFGYVETYTNNKYPHMSKDISSHSNFERLVFRKDEKTGDYIHHINRALKETTLTDKESWELSDLMKRFYTLKESAAIFGRGTAHLTSNTRHNSTNLDLAKYINEVELPNIFKAVIDLLKPD